ncbi:unnamed protein product [Dicrocoelium dendriticum]|nr:unnamed protein product [Dicrocoelium dendriticum]
MRRGMSFNSQSSSNNNAEVVDDSLSSKAPEDIIGKISDLMKEVLVPAKRIGAIVELHKLENSIPEFGHALYSRPAVLSAILLIVVQNYPQLAVPLSSELKEVICAIAGLLQKIVRDHMIRSDFIASGSLLYLLPYMDLRESTPEAEEMRLSLLNLYLTTVNYASAEDIEMHLLYVPTDWETKTWDAVIDTKYNLLDSAITTLTSCISMVGKQIAVNLCYRLLTDKVIARLSEDTHRCTSLLSSLKGIVCHVVQTLYVARSQCTASGKYHKAEMVNWVRENSSLDGARRLLCLVLKCYHRIADDERMRYSLTACLPDELKVYIPCFGDKELGYWLKTLQSRLGYTVEKAGARPLLTGH